MPRRLIRLPGEPLLNLTNYARSGPTRSDQLSRTEVEQIRRTVRRAPEVVVKVLARGRHDVAGGRAHLAYVSRGGRLELETDEGERVAGDQAWEQVLDSWDLDLESERPRADLQAFSRRGAPKLFHKVTLSMPPGTPPEKVLAAAQNFAREEFALKHRYAMVLHTDEPHPHVHLVIKAQSEQGTRLHIRKATLRDWRRQFAKHLRGLGVPANATERAVRGKIQKAKTDGIYRTAVRGESYQMRDRVEGIARDLIQSNVVPEAGRAKLLATRRAVEEGWRAVSEMLSAQGYSKLALEVRRFVSQVPPVRTDREMIADRLRERMRQPRVRDDAPTR
jgi:hypothetical protein